MSKEIIDVVTPLLSLSDLNEVEACSHAEEMTFKDSLGEDTEIKVMVLGAHATSVQRDVNKQINRMRRETFKAEKSGKVAQPRDAEDDIDNGIAGIAKRVVGWSGLQEKWSPQFALQFCTQNPSFREQVREFSEDLGNFGNSK